MKLSFTTLGCPGWSLQQIADNASKYGYDGIELRTQTDWNHFSPESSADEAKRVGDMFRNKGVPVQSVMGYCKFAFTDPAEVKKNQDLMRRLIVVADAMGAKHIRTFAGAMPKGENHDKITEIVAAAIKPLAAEAAEKGVRIGLETHDDWCAGARVQQVVELVGNVKGFGIVYDIFNSYTTGIEPWDVTYAKVKPHICYCHVKDGYKTKDGKHVYTMVGAGELPLAEVIKAFKKDNYTGFFSFEWEKKWHPEIEDPERAFPQFPIKLRQWWGAS